MKSIKSKEKMLLVELGKPSKNSWKAHGWKSENMLILIIAALIATKKFNKKKLVRLIEIIQNAD